MSVLKLFAVNSSNFDLLALFELIASDQSDAALVLQKTFDWRHSRGLEVGKWFLAIGLSLFVAYLSLFSKDLLVNTTSPVPTYLHVVLVAFATLCCITGLAAIWRLRQLDRRYTHLATLVAELEEIRPFLQLLRRDGIL